ncbi:MAG: methyltransferase domain-containing protein [Defluviicoccus sp.]|nr:methyltransferase domain-containing protein [Defluviicoccus sp.]MDG4592535.1 methyltransferase domain-containing protein [Defluviicoccus sp.]
MNSGKLRHGARRTTDNADAAFFKIWLRRPGQLGAVLPSSRGLATAVAACIDVNAPGVVVELGGGTGKVTEALLDAGVPASSLIVVECEPALCDVIAARLPDVRLLCADARDLKPLLTEHGITEPVKAVVSGIPLLCLTREDCQRILSAAFEVMGEHGDFVQFTYGPASPVPREVCQRVGISGRRARWIVSNLPPASVWHYRRAQAGRRR